MLTDFGAHNIVWQHIPELEVGTACGAEVTVRGGVSAFHIIHALDEFGNQRIQIGVALAMRVRLEIHRHEVDARREVGAVVEIESTQEILRRLASACMLRGDHAGHRFEDLAAAQVRPVGDLLRTSLTFGRCGSDANKVLGFTRDDDFAHLGWAWRSRQVWWRWSPAQRQGE